MNIEEVAVKSVSLIYAMPSNIVVLVHNLRKIFKFLMKMYY